MKTNNDIKNLRPEDFKNSEAPDEVFCRMNNTVIKSYECIENRDVVDRLIAESSLPAKFKVKENWREICKACPWYNFGD